MDLIKLMSVTRQIMLQFNKMQNNFLKLMVINLLFVGLAQNQLIHLWDKEKFNLQDKEVYLILKMISVKL